MPIVIYKLAKVEVIDGKRRVLGRTERWYVHDPGKDFHTQHGVIAKGMLVPGKVSVGGQDFVIVPATFADRYRAIRRKAQIITRKDIGFIAAHCCLTKESVVVESGAGSGGATALLAASCGHVHSYEIDQESVSLVRENLARLGLANATLVHADFYDPSVPEAHEADLVLLDLPEPWRAYESARKAARLGGYVVAYTPSIVQASHFTGALPPELLHERTCELIERDWKVQGDALRPVSAAVGHTAFLTFARRIL